jgi:hypothetical protein
MDHINNGEIPDERKGNPFFHSLVKVKNQLIEHGRENIRDTEKYLLFSKQGTNETDWTFSILYLIGLFLLALLIIFITAFFVKILWNFVIPPLFGLDKVNRITWLSAVSLLVLVRILFF